MSDEFPEATLEHVYHYVPANPYATDYPRWKGVVMQDNRIIAEVYLGIGDPTFKRRPGS